MIKCQFISLFHDFGWALVLIKGGNLRMLLSSKYSTFELEEGELSVAYGGCLGILMDKWSTAPWLLHLVRTQQISRSILL